MPAQYITIFGYMGKVAKAVSIADNFLAILVFLGTKHLRSRYYGFFLNLALANLVFSLFSVVYFGLPSRVTILLELSRTGYVVSVLTILAVAVNRYLALSLMPPARYDALVTRARLAGVCLCLWVFTLLVYVLPVLVSTNEVRSTIKALVRPLGMILVWIITTLLYFLVFRKIRRFTTPLASSSGINPNDEQVNTRVQHTRRLMMIFTFVLVTSFICWVPFSLAQLIRYFKPSLYSAGAPFHAFYWTATFLYVLNPTISPLIYWWRLKEFRAGFYALFCRCFVKAQSRETEVQTEMAQTEAATVNAA